MHILHRQSRNALLAALAICAPLCAQGDLAAQPVLFGRSVLGLSDLDGDGTPDFAVGAPKFPHGEARYGVVLVLSGATREVLQTWRGEPGRGGFGESLRAAGDVDGDGTGDVLVDYGWQARCELRSGKDGARLAAFDRLPYEITPLGDVTRDGRQDLMLRFGTSFEMRGGPHGGLLQSPTGHLPGTTFYPVGDLNGDGVVDLLFGPTDPELRLSDLGPRDAPLTGDLYPRGHRKRLPQLWPELFRPRHTSASSLEQATLRRFPATAGGDLDGDQHPDVLVFCDWQGSTTVVGLSTRQAKPLFSISNPGAGHNTVLTGRDLNADGHEDIVLAQPTNAIAIRVWAYSGRDGSLLWRSSWDDAGVSTHLELAWLAGPTGEAGVLVGLTSNFPGPLRHRIGELRLLNGESGALCWKLGAVGDTESGQNPTPK